MPSIFSLPIIEPHIIEPPIINPHIVSALDAPVFFEWGDFTNQAAADNGVVHSGPTNSWGAGRTTVAVASGFAMEITITSAIAAGDTMYLQIMDADGATGSIWHNIPEEVFGAAFTLGDLKPQKNNGLGSSIGTIVEGSVVGIREKTGAIEILLNDSVVHTFPDAVPSSIAGRVSIHEAAGAPMPNIRDVS